MSEDNIFVVLLDAISPLVDILLDIIPFPFNAIVAFIFGGVEEVLLEVLFA